MRWRAHGKAEHARHLREVALRHEDLLRFLRQGVSVILHHHDGLELRLVAGLHEFGLAHDGGGGGRVQVRILEQARAEGVQQQADGRGLEARAGRFLAEVADPHLVGLQDGTLIIVAAELVHAGLDYLVVALRNRETFHAPALAVEGFDGGVVVGNVPVRANHAVKAVFLPEQIRNDVFAEVVAHIVPGRVDVIGDGVVGHHRRGLAGAALQVEGALGEGLQVVLKVSAGINGVFPIIEVRIPSAFLRTAGGPVLDHRIDTLGTPAVLGAGRRLETIDIGAGHVRVQGGILAESAAETAPARFGGQVDLRAQRRGDAQCAIFLGGDLAELFHEGRVEGGGHAQGGGPEGDLAAGAQVELGRRRGFMARVGGVVGRDAVPQRLGERLHVVVPAGGHFRAFHRGHEDGPEVVFREELLLRLGDFRCTYGLVAAVQHQAGDFLDGKLGGQIPGAGLGGKAPVLVRVQAAVAVQVLEGVAVHGQQRCASVAERRAALLDDEPVAVGLGFIPLGAAGRQGQGKKRYGQKGKPFFHGISHYFVPRYGFLCMLPKEVREDEKQ